MVRSDIGAAGVLFTLDTETGFRDAVFITSSYGLGETVVQGAVITTGVAGWLALVAVVSMRLDVSLWYGVVAPIPVLLAGSAVGAWRVWVLATGLRYLEVLVWAMRYHAAFALIGAPLDPTTALAFACVSMIASMIPFLRLARSCSWVRCSTSMRSLNSGSSQGMLSPSDQGAGFGFRLTKSKIVFIILTSSQ